MLIYCQLKVAVVETETPEGTRTPMNPLMKPIFAARAIVAFVRLVRDPNELEQVFRILDALEESKDGKAIVAEFRDNPANAAAFHSRHGVGTIDLDALGRLPLGTLGRTFADDMRRRGLDPAAIEKRQGDTDADYVFSHLRESHDVWHTATGFDVDVAGELGLQAFYLTQFRAPLALIILAMGLLNTFFFAMDDRTRRFDAIARGWALGRRSKKLFGFDWKSHWAAPLDEVRVLLRLDEPREAVVVADLALDPVTVRDTPRAILAASRAA